MGRGAMSDITLSNGIRSNLLSLQSTSDLLDRTQNRLATGKKVNSALDDPLNYFQSATLKVRSNDLRRLLDGINLGVKTLEAADNALKAITRLVETAQAGARTSLQTAATNAKLGSGADRDYRPNPVTNVMPDIADIATIVITPTRPAGLPPAYPVAAAFTVNVPVAIADRVPGDTTGRTAQSIANAINRSAGNLGPTIGGAVQPYVHAEVDSGGRFIVDNVSGGTLRLQVTGAGAGIDDLFGTIPPPTGAATATDTGVMTSTVNETRMRFADQYEGLLDQITNLARDAGFNGTNLLNGQTLDVIFNEESTTRLVVRGVTFDATGLGITRNDTAYDFQSDVEVNRAVGVLQEALAAIRAQAAVFGANMTVAKTRQDFTKEAVKTLDIGSDQLVVADINEEGANLLALQTRQQLSTQALSLAAQSEQAVLRLFN
jgi:flagellin-like hook-associated protein FlgL